MESEPDDGQQLQENINALQAANIIIAADYEEEEYDILQESQPTTEANPLAPQKGKYYKQTYRPAWEHMPDFQGWLRGVQGQPTRAYCAYCQKTLHAHRLSLLKHTCTIRHQKAAQKYSREQNSLMEQNIYMEAVESEETLTEEHENEEDGHTVIQYTTVEDSQDLETTEIVEDKDVNASVVHAQLQKEFKSTPTTVLMAAPAVKPAISTHVLDTSRGAPVASLQVSLYKLIDGRWTYINEGSTNPDGRFSNFLEQAEFTPGRYKLHYDVDRYFDQKKQESLYPFIEIVFDCRTLGEHYHVPLLLSPFGYTTYRGS